MDLELQSVTSEVSGNVEAEGAFNDEDAWSGGIRSISMTSKHTTTPVSIMPSNRDVAMAAGDTGDYCMDQEEERNKRHSVHISEPVASISRGSDVHKEQLTPHPPSAKTRPKSAITSSRTHHHYHNDAKSSNGIIKPRPKSARMRNVKAIATVALDYGPQDDAKEQNGSVESKNLAKDSRMKKRPEIETMMSRISLSDEENDPNNDGNTNKPTEHSVQYSSKSSSKTNFYKAASTPSQAMLTTKTMAFTDTGIQESKSVSMIGQVQVTERPPVGRWIGGQRTHSAITRPRKTNSTVSF